MDSRSKAYAALGNANRRRLLESLRRAPQTVNELASRMEISRPAVSQQLRILMEAELVRGIWKGNRHIFSLRADRMAELRADLDSLWSDALGAFADHMNKKHKESHNES